MPANLTPEYMEAERAYKSAETPSEKIGALEHMLAALPKHKGTEKMYADLKRRLSQVRKESQKKGVAHSTPFYLVKKEGAGQVALVGPPNSGKSRLLCTLTHARPEVGDYPFTTRMPTPGMMAFENLQIQLVDLPPISPEFSEPWIPQVIRNADMSVLFVDLADPDLLGEIEFVLETLKDRRLPLPKLVAGNKADLPGAAENLSVLEELYGATFRWVSLSLETGWHLDVFGRTVFQALEIVRVYTKAPGKKADLSTPFVLERGKTVIDAARMVHREFAEHLRYARLYRLNHEHGGMMVERTHLLEDEDILEFHL